MRYIGIGDLVIDYYYKNNKFLFKCGGKTFANIIFNLNYFGLNTKILGCCGNDEDGDITINTLGSTDIKDIKRINKPTRKFIIDEKTTIKSANWYKVSLIDKIDILNKIYADDILIFDSMSTKNKYIVDNTSNIKVIDIGGISIVRRANINKLKNDFYKKFKIINMNEKVADFIMSFYKINETDIYDTFGSEILIITRGNKGFSIFTNNKRIDKTLNNPEKEIDTNGCGDMFFAYIIKFIFNDNGNIERTDTILEDLYKYTGLVASTYGSRGYALNLSK